MSLDNLHNQVNSSETSEENKDIANEGISIANQIIQNAEKYKIDTSIIKKEYQDVKDVIIESLKEDQKITRIELDSLKKEVNEMINLDEQYRFQEQQNQKPNNEELQKALTLRDEIINSKIPEEYKIMLDESLGKVSKLIQNDIKNDILTDETREKFYDLLDGLSKVILIGENIQESDLKPVNDLLTQMKIVSNTAKLSNENNPKMVEFNNLLKNKNINIDESTYFITTTIVELEKGNITIKEVSDILDLFQTTNIDISKSKYFAVETLKQIKSKKVTIEDLTKILNHFDEETKGILYDINEENLIFVIENSSSILKLIDGKIDELNKNEYDIVKNDIYLLNKFPLLKNKVYENNFGGNENISLLNKDILVFIQDPNMIKIINDFTNEISSSIKNGNDEESKNIIEKYININLLDNNIMDALTFINSIAFSQKLNGYKNYCLNINQKINNVFERRKEDLKGFDIDLNNIKSENELYRKLKSENNKNDNKLTDTEIKEKIKTYFYGDGNSEDNTKVIEVDSEANKALNQLKAKHGDKINKLINKPGVSIDEKGNLIIEKKLDIGENGTIEMGNDGELIFINSLGYNFKFNQNLNKSGDKMFDVTEKMDFLNKLGFGYMGKDFKKLINRIQTIHGSKIGMNSININENDGNFLNDTEFMTLSNVFYKLGYFDNPSEGNFQARPKVINKTEFANKIENTNFYSMSMGYSDDTLDKAMKEEVYS